jgi:hypothetical protein
MTPTAGACGPTAFPAFPAMTAIAVAAGVGRGPSLTLDEHPSPVQLAGGGILISNSYDVAAGSAMTVMTGAAFALSLTVMTALRTSAAPRRPVSAPLGT